MKKSLFFILGYPRSGTTWFANILNSHPDFIYRHEVLGRLYQAIPTETFESLKKGSLDPTDRDVLLKSIRKADIETDRPPFFKKSHLTFGNAKIHHKAWLAAKAFSPFSFIYRFIYQPQADNGCLLVKETRSTINMNNILHGLDPDTVIFLFRHPFGVINSIFNGRKKGLMNQQNEKERHQWFSDHIQGHSTPYANLDKSAILDMSEAEFLAHQWCKHNQDFIALSKQTRHGVFVNYDALLADPLSGSEQLFNKLNMPMSLSTREFLSESTSTDSSQKSLLERDASDSFYSVFRDKSSLDTKYSALSVEDKTSIEKICSETLMQLKAQCNA